jgi:flagellar hook assembly protein FlgD
LRRDSAVRLDVFDMAGRHVRTVDIGRQGPGTTVVDFDGLDEDRRTLPSGTYVVRARADHEIATEKMVIVR